MTAPARLSGVVIAFQEADRIADCLRSLAFCDEILVVDSGSTDGTQDLARSLGARVLERPWPGHVAQKEWAIRAAAHDWVFCLDADERCTATLVDEIKALRAAGFAGHAGYEMRRRTSYLGRWIRFGGWNPDRKLRLFDRRQGHWGGHDPHDHVQLEGTVGRLRGRLLHDAYRGLEDHLQTIERYTTIMAEGMHARGRRARPLDLLTRPAARFVRFYVLKLGFLDGWRGLLIACLAARYAQLKYAKLLAMARQQPTACPADVLPGTFGTKPTDQPERASDR
ncbi:MAG: glycosyltransferase family 2 protein [Planctomycetota bacterium]|jgi:glycosyltransferase involved in cell wall biosynthesis